MPRVTVPSEGTAACAACRKPRGNSRRGWVPILRGSELLGFTCGTCPQASEPIRRMESAAGVRFRAVVDATPRGAVQRRQVTRTLPTLEAARLFVIAVRAEVEHAGAFSAPDTESVTALCERWPTSRRDVRPVTAEGYRNHLTPVLRLIGSRDVREIGLREVEIMIGTLAREGGKRGQPLGPRSVRAALVALGQVFDLAAREGAISRNVVRLARRPRQRKRVGRDLEHWQPAELLAFRETTDRDALTAAWRCTLSGLTRADVMGLRWSDVDLDLGTVTVRTGRVALDHGDHTDEPKSAQRRRKVPIEVIHPGSVALLRSLKVTQATDRLKAGAAWTESGLVVVDALGVPLRPETYSDHFGRLCAAAGVTKITLHSVRHSLAFMLTGLGVLPSDAAALLGHTTEVFLSTYNPERGATGIAAAAAALGRANGA